MKEDEWHTLSNAPQPFVSIELGYLSNIQDAELFADREFLDKAAVGLYNGLNSFVTFIEK
jgi:N-acetylmuramoyl-L-alanine amidase